MRNDRTEDHLIERLEKSLGERLVSVVAYGPTTHDDDYRIGPARHVLIVLRDLAPSTLRMVADPVRWWLAGGESWPRLFTPQLLRESADVYPLEILDITMHRRVAFGSDPLGDVTIDRACLRAQCERELREKLMRLREGYVEMHNTERLRELLATSFPAFVRIFRGCLYLLDAPIAQHDHDVVVAICARLDLSPDAFANVERVARGDRSVDLDAAFAAYYDALTAAAQRIDRLVIQKEKTP